MKRAFHIASLTALTLICTAGSNIFSAVEDKVAIERRGEWNPISPDEKLLVEQLNSLSSELNWIEQEVVEITDRIVLLKDGFFLRKVQFIEQRKVNYEREVTALKELNPEAYQRRLRRDLPRLFVYEREQLVDIIDHAGVNSMVAQRLLDTLLRLITQLHESQLNGIETVE
jgi:hypothetical protein